MPPHIPLNLLIDTGATSTLVDDQHMRSLGIAPTGATMLHSSSTGGIAHPCDLFAVQLVLGGLSNPATTWRIDPIEIVVLNFIGEGVDGLLGRDVLDRTQLSYNSPRGQVTLSYV